MDKTRRGHKHRVTVADLGGVLLPFAFSSVDVIARPFDQIGQFVFALTVKFDAAPMRRDLTLQPLRFGADVCYLDVDLVQRAPLFGEFGLVAIGLSPGWLLRSRHL